MSAVRGAAAARRSPQGASPGFVLAVVALAAAIGAFVVQMPLVATAAILLVGAATAVVARPELVTVAVVFVMYLDVPAVAVKYQGAPLLIGLVIPLLLTIPLAYHLHRGARLVLTPTFGLILLFLATQVVSAVLSVSVLEATEEVKTFVIEGALVYFLVTNVVRTPETLRAATWAIVVAGGLLGAVSVFQEVTQSYSRPYGGFAQVPPEFFSGHSERARLAGPLGDPNYYAQILLAVLPLALFRVWGERSRTLRMAALAAAGFATAGILLTYSRGAGLAFAVIFVLMLLFRYVRGRHVLLVVVGVVIALVALPEYTERIRTVGDVGSATSEAGSGEAEAADISVRSRATEMLTAWFMFVDHPVLGVGPGLFGEYYGDYAARIQIEVREEVKFGPRRGEAPERESHNMFLTIAAELGLVGLLFFVGVIVATIRALGRARRRWRGDRPDIANLVVALMLAVIAYVTAGLFLTLAFERYFWLLIALAGAAAVVEPGGRESRDERPRTGRQPGRAFS